MVDEILDIGAFASKRSWTNRRTSQPLQRNLMAVLTSDIIAAVASASQRSTRAGGTWRSAIAPNISGETNAASALVAKANGLIACSPCASSTLPSGTNQIAHRHALDEKKHRQFGVFGLA